MGQRLPTATDVIVPGLVAGALFSGAAALFGRRDSGSAAAALNAPTHVVYGESALDEQHYTSGRRCRASPSTSVQACSGQR